jgi:hypothetical protein
MKMELIQCSETPVYNIQTPGNYPEDNILHPQQGESLKTTNLNESKFRSGRKYEQTEVRECLLTFGAESFVFQFAIEKYKEKYIQNYNFTGFIVWV